MAGRHAQPNFPYELSPDQVRAGAQGLVGSTLDGGMMISPDGRSISFGSFGLAGVTYDGTNRVTGFSLGGVTYTVTYAAGGITVSGSDTSKRVIALDGSGRISGVS